MEHNGKREKAAGKKSGEGKGEKGKSTEKKGAEGKGEKGKGAKGGKKQDKKDEEQKEATPEPTETKDEAPKKQQEPVKDAMTVSWEAHVARDVAMGENGKQVSLISRFKLVFILPKFM